MQFVRTGRTLSKGPTFASYPQFLGTDNLSYWPFFSFQKKLQQGIIRRVMKESKKKGFALFEFLIIIAIIAVLLAVAFVAITSAKANKENSKQTSALVNRAV